jgi:hypothetical protein
MTGYYIILIALLIIALWGFLLAYKEDHPRIRPSAA